MIAVAPAADVGRHKRVPIIDPLPTLIQAASARDERLFYFPDPHMTAAGHRVIAEEQARFFAANRLPRGAEARVASPATR